MSARGSEPPIFAAPMLLDSVITCVTSMTPWLCVSWKVWPYRLHAPGEVSTLDSGFHLPLASAAEIVTAFIVEPGSTTSVTARLRRYSAGALPREFGLYDGRLTIAMISPVFAFITTIEPDFALCLRRPSMSSR
jgi:hypothetical protein